MPNLNRVMLMGNLTRDPETKYTPKGMAVCGFGIAINRSYSTDDGTKHEDVTFIDIEAWSKTAEVIGQYLKKGSPIFIEGRLKLDQWDDAQTGQKRSKLKVVCERFEFLGGKDKGEEPEAPSQPSSRDSGHVARAKEVVKKTMGYVPPKTQEVEDDDVPF